MPKIKPKEVSNYEFLDFDGKKVKFLSLFGDKNDLILVHNMGTSCRYCTMWGDGFNSILPHIKDRSEFVVVSNDKPSVQKKFHKSRAWKFKMVSSFGNSFTSDMSMGTPKNPMPGVSTFYKKGSKIFRVGKDKFGPGDKFCIAWHFFDLLKDGANGWEPKYRY